MLRAYMCSKLHHVRVLARKSITSGDEQELQANVINIVNKHDNTKDQSMSDEDDSVMTVPADKDRVTVVMNKNEYYGKCN